jgi:hypothetical protein
MEKQKSMEADDQYNPVVMVDKESSASMLMLTMQELKLLQPGYQQP